MTAPKMTRKRALELAGEALLRWMTENRRRVSCAREPGPALAKAEAEYAELAAALAIIENMSRQQEMHL